MDETPEPAHPPDSPTGVRQGKRGGIVRVILAVSMGLAILGLVLAFALS